MRSSRPTVRSFCFPPGRATEFRSIYSHWISSHPGGSREPTPPASPFSLPTERGGGWGGGGGRGQKLFFGQHHSLWGAIPRGGGRAQVTPGARHGTGGAR